MAKLITTKAEKEAASYLDWSDEALGCLCKKMALTMRAVRQKKMAKAKKDDDLDAVINAADGILLVGSVIACNAGKLTLQFGDFTHEGKASGDWQLTIRKLPTKRKP